MAQTTKLFWHGRSQAVRLPKAFRIEGDEVRIRRQGRSAVLEPITKDWAWLDAIAGTFSDDFFAEGRRQPDQQHRPELDPLFG
ncbi:MAG: type II toxin-antitoxin system VapB family antitoxin [Acidobacteriota bacterium]|nr:type II toxin-antitoxin system VapB family antitoxin [Acidobacteriota bacterium]MDE3261530.1 type II toxin-antitoxin system VapB family antitoxin [Acidobacteriota bacterium]